VTAVNVILGYVQDPKNQAVVVMVDDNVPKVFGDWGVTEELWDVVRKDRTGIVMSGIQAARWHKKVGDTFTMISKQMKRADGGTTWTFKVLAIGPDFPQNSNGYILGNYDYIDKARPLADQGKIGEADLLANDPATSTELAARIDRTFANSATPLVTITEKLARAGGDFAGLPIKPITRGIALAGMFMVLFLTANGLAQAVRERYAEFATLKTIGFSDSGVIALVFAEAAIPCLMGAGLGIGLASIVSNVMPRFLPPGQGLPIPTMTIMVFVWAGLCAALVAFISAALPALRLKQMDIATALSGR
jgi:putative ABC transport system permease protein